MKAVILAGGKGTRLRPLTYTNPKPLLPLAGQPAIVHLVRKLASEGIGEIVVTTNYFANWLRAALGDDSRYGVRIHHVEEKIPLGTAGSVKNSEALIDETFLVVQGDNQFEFSPRDVIEHHRKLGAAATLALLEVENPCDYGIAELSGGRIIRFLEKPKPEECFSNLINCGFYVLEPEVLKLVPEGRMFDFSRNLFPLMLESEMTIGGLHASGFWVDIGDPQSYLKANTWALDRLERKRPRAKDRIPFGSNASASEGATIERPVYLGRNVRIHNGAVIGPYSCIGNGCEILAGARVNSSVVYDNTWIGANAVLDRCIVAEDCRIGNRVQIERNAVVGAGTELGDDSRLTLESKVGPWAIVQTSAVVEGTVTAFKNNIETISELLEKSSPGVGLGKEEGRICGALLELRQANAETISQSARVPLLRARSLLSELRERGIVTSLTRVPGMFALAQEPRSKSQET